MQASSIALEKELENIIITEAKALGRPDLFRRPLVAFSAADDPRYWQLKDIIGPWHKTPEELLPGAVSVISYFMPFTRPVAAQPKTFVDGAPLWCEAYCLINQGFDHINQALSAYLAAAGYASAPIAATHTYDPKDLKSLWSHRSAAAIAGLGSFGANRLLITEKGSAGRFSTLLTTADLPTRREPPEPRCLYMTKGSCGLCFKVCPVHALRDDGFDRFACLGELDKNDARQRAATGWEADVCGKCISVCPWAYIE